jgi:hypothetical protein
MESGVDKERASEHVDGSQAARRGQSGEGARTALEHLLRQEHQRRRQAPADGAAGESRESPAPRT